MATDSDAACATALKECRHGRMLYLRGDRYIGRSLELYGEYIELEARTLTQVLAPGQLVVEVGANIGAHTICLAKLLGPSGTLIAFEPQRSMFYLLCANLALNDQFHVRAYREAIGDAEGTVEVPLLDFRAADNFGGVSLLAPCEAPTERVALTTIDRLALPSLRLLKIDVEGMEIEVVRGARRTIAAHRPIIYVENDRRDRSPELIGLLLQLGYELYWDLPRLYNPDNFAGYRRNVFSELIAINMICLPAEHEHTVTGLRRVHGTDDWWDKR